MQGLFRRLWADDEGQDIAEYAVILAVILLLVVGTIKLIGTNANSTFSNVASSVQQLFIAAGFRDAHGWHSQGAQSATLATGISALTSFNLGSRSRAASNSLIT